MENLEWVLSTYASPKIRLRRIRKHLIIIIIRFCFTLLGKIVLLKIYKITKRRPRQSNTLRRATEIKRNLIWKYWFENLIGYALF